MVAKNTTTIVVMLACFSSGQGIAVGGDTEPSGIESQEYSRELTGLKAMQDSFTSRSTNDLSKYEKFVNEIQHKWSQRNEGYYARLMLVACGPLSSGSFKDARRHELARKYALSALENRDAIPLTLELELIGHAMTPTIGPDAPKEEAFAERRRKDVDVRLHAWKRLMDAIDQKWDPDEILRGPNAVGAEMGLPSGIAPEGVEDAAIRAKYEAALRENRQTIERYSEQHKLHLWLKTFPKSVESYIVQAYSHAPCDVEELKKSLDEYKIEENARGRILDAVTKNCAEKKQE